MFLRSRLSTLRRPGGRQWGPLIKTIFPGVVLVPYNLPAFGTKKRLAAFPRILARLLEGELDRKERISGGREDLGI